VLPPEVDSQTRAADFPDAAPVSRASDWVALFSSGLNSSGSLSFGIGDRASAFPPRYARRSRVTLSNSVSAPSAYENVSIETL
jgi:hypothetical protein